MNAFTVGMEAVSYRVETEHFILFTDTLITTIPGFHKNLYSAAKHGGLYVNIAEHIRVVKYFWHVPCRTVCFGRIATAGPLMEVFIS